jgi:hypothetical protein
MLTATGLRRSELGPRGRKLVRHKGKQVFDIAEQGRLLAIGNRCPHEGYPLSEGTIGPASAPWLAEYLNEMAVFPNGKHNDQVDSTTQFLDWFKKPFPCQGIFE